jgi:hypothetical protein
MMMTLLTEAMGCSRSAGGAKRAMKKAMDSLSRSPPGRCIARVGSPGRGHPAVGRTSARSARALA